MYVTLNIVEDYIHVKFVCSHLEKILLSHIILFCELNCECHNPTCRCGDIINCDCIKFWYQIVEE